MKKSLFYWQLTGSIFTSIGGVLLHFFYDWSNQSVLVALFSAVNESIWEHMKLLFFPMFVFALMERLFIGEEYENFWCAKLAGFVLGLALIPVLYYSYTGIFGVSLDWLNIIIFFLAAASASSLETWLFKQEQNDCCLPLAALFILCLIGLAFVYFTYLPPEIPLFQDPQGGGRPFGIQ